MPNDGAVPASMAAVNALYQTRNTIIASPGGDFERILTADSRRYAVAFWFQMGPGSFALYPGPRADWPLLSIASQTVPVVYLWRDFPSWVTGEWWAFTGVGDPIFISECLYVGG